MSRNAVVTGIGVVAPSGNSAAHHWDTVLAGENRLTPIAAFDASRYGCGLAGQVGGFDPEDHIDRKLIVQTDRWTWMSLAATAQAFADADLDPAQLDPYRMSVALASSSGGNHFGQREMQRLWTGPNRTVSAYQSIAWFYAATVGQTSIAHQMKGPASVVIAEAAGGLDSFAVAARLIRRGADVVLAGGTEAPLSPYALACQQSSGWLSPSRDPRRAYRPFDTDATGFVPAEGGAVLVVEEESHAIARGVPYIYGEIAGHAATHDGRRSRPHGVVAEDLPSDQLAAALRLALDRAGAAATAVDVLFADALGVPAADRAEAAALREVFPAGVPVTGQKALLGRAYQGSSALEVATALLAMREGLLPAFGTATPHADLDLIPAARAADVDVAAVVARGFDGFNSALILRRHGGMS
ncbi:beta-ketoacyl synthase N-terminal-like domain-containing protein [Nocardia sp. alder85J]|uniref:beta-ketoacyl synthase N-terminal-like domain-containing protein n=1 Tax=Nocardia sp. alder85J TaxID=2862949 RepID=UPI001CD48FAA|nr:beta-ketoacyl synthase N-terminal-like domain-containing protein [Nocardia sp. alder85J]MCX4094708.1 beta-ketoacyl synthase N-terminal-like domain-containing protein [Nocardia sp. alder85J]